MIQRQLQVERFAAAFCVYLTDFFAARRGIQPERLNAEGFARVLVAGGGALAQPPECKQS